MPLRPRSQGQWMPRCPCLHLRVGQVALASQKNSGFYLEVVQGLTEQFSSHLTGEDTKAQNCQSLSESRWEPRTDS